MMETACNSAVPILLLLALPVGALATRFGLMRSPLVRAVILLLVVAIFWLKTPIEGFRTAELDRVKLVVATSVAILVAARHRLSQQTRQFAVLLAAVLGVLLHYNLFSFHGHGNFTHVHDLAHYYLGAKYAAEIGYGELYATAARAEHELHQGRMPVEHARDLMGGGIVPIVGLLEQGERIAERMPAPRWESFRADVEALHEWMGPAFAAFLNDHGYNPTPVWSLVGGAIANLVSAGSRDGMRFLTLFDPVLLAIAFLFVAWGFGIETACLAVAYYGILYGAIFDWTGGAFLRNLWFASILIAASLWQRGRAISAGPFLAIASTLRIFPAFLLLAPAASFVASIVRRSSAPGEDGRLLSSVIASAALLLLATLFVGGGIGAWLGFYANLDAHTDTLSSNFVGLPAWLRYAVLGIGLGGEAQVEELFAPTSFLYRVLTVGLLVGSSSLAVAASFRTQDPATKLAVGLFPIAFALRLAHYYSVVLVLLILAHRSRDDRLAVIFGAEAVLYLLALFEVHFSVMCLYRGLVVAYLLVAVWFDEIGNGARSLLMRPAPAASLAEP